MFPQLILRGQSFFAGRNYNVGKLTSLAHKRNNLVGALLREILYKGCGHFSGIMNY